MLTSQPNPAFLPTVEILFCDVPTYGASTRVSYVTYGFTGGGGPKVCLWDLRFMGGSPVRKYVADGSGENTTCLARDRHGHLFHGGPGAITCWDFETGPSRLSHSSFRVGNETLRATIVLRAVFHNGSEPPLNCTQGAHACVPAYNSRRRAHCS